MGCIWKNHRFEALLGLFARCHPCCRLTPGWGAWDGITGSLLPAIFCNSNCFSRLPLTPTVSGGMTGPQNHTKQTPNLRGYDWKTRVWFFSFWEIGDHVICNPAPEGFLLFFLSVVLMIDIAQKFEIHLCLHSHLWSVRTWRIIPGLVL